jgi:hypothetical protein
LVACGAALAACSSILGIEDLSSEPRQGTAAGANSSGGMGQGGASTGGTGGGSAAGGRMASGGSSGTSGKAGASTGGGSAGLGAGGAAAGSGNSGGMGAVGGAGTAGSGMQGGSGGGAGTGATSGPVHGTIVDFWHHPLATVEVAIGAATTMTGDDGTFDFDDVPATYDVSFIITLPNPYWLYGWVYQGLTRRDPTLQVMQGLDAQEATFIVSQKNGGSDFSNDQQWFVAFGSKHGAQVFGADAPGVQVDPDWQGPMSNDWTLHSLFFKRDDVVATEYTAYETQEFTGVSSADADRPVTVDLTPQSNIDTDTISGSVTDANGASMHTNYAFVRFSSGAVIPVVDGTDTTAKTFSYLVPDLANSSISVASAVRNPDYSYAIAHSDKRALGDTGIDLQIPKPASGLQPSNDATGVDDDTTFMFQPGDPNNSGYLVQIEDQTTNHNVIIVTAKHQFSLGELPVVGGKGNLLKGNPQMWHVQTHGKFASVDEMAGPDGFLDDFWSSDTRPFGPARKDGVFTDTTHAYFTAAP